MAASGGDGVRVLGCSNLPEGWQVVRLKFLLHGMEQGWSPQCDNVPAEDHEWGVLKAGCANGWQFNPQENKRLPADLDPLPEYEVKPGNIIMSRANTTELLGSAAYVKETRPRLLLCDKLYRLKINADRVSGEYLVSFLRSSLARAQMEPEATGSSNSMQNIGQDTVQNLIVPLPPLPTQRAIVAYLDRETEHLDALSGLSNKSLNNGATECQAIVSHRTHECSRTLLKDH